MIRIISSFAEREREMMVHTIFAVDIGHFDIEHGQKKKKKCTEKINNFQKRFQKSFQNRSQKRFRFGL